MKTPESAGAVGGVLSLSKMAVAEKRALVQGLHEGARRGESVLSESARQNIRALAADPEWAVRQDVAELLVFIPDEDFDSLSPALLDDPNAYVRRAAEHSKQRRRAARHEAKRASRGLDLFAEQYELFARRHGAETAAEAMRLSDRRFELVSAALAHDLLGMLASIRSQARTVSDALPKKDAASLETAKELNCGLTLMEESLKDLLGYAQTLKVERAAESVRNIVEMAKKQTENALNDSGSDFSVVSISVAGVADLTLDVSRHLLIRALGNLIKNACETFMDKKGNVSAGKVTVVAAKCDGQIEITVHNTGKGLTPEKLRALTSWMPAQKNRNKKNSRGYGLLNAKKIIEAHGGTLDFTSQPNEGVTAIIVLPA